MTHPGHAARVVHTVTHNMRIYRNKWLLIAPGVLVCVSSLLTCGYLRTLLEGLLTARITCCVTPFMAAIEFGEELHERTSDGRWVSQSLLLPGARKPSSAAAYRAAKRLLEAGVLAVAIVALFYYTVGRSIRSKTQVSRY